MAGRDLREVRHCGRCARPMIRVPVLTCTDCQEEHRLRCFTYRRRGGPYIAECVDLDILAQGDNQEEAIGKLQEAVFSYLDVAFEGATGGLVLRPSPWNHRLRYNLHRAVSWLLQRLHRGASHFVLPLRASERGERLSHC